MSSRDLTSARRRARREAPPATRATWPSVISGKNGSAIDRAATSSQIGEFSGPVAERLAVVAHQMDRREVRLARHPDGGEVAHNPVTVEPPRELNDVHEPAAPRASGIRAREPKLVEPRQRLAVQRRDPSATGEHRVEAVELREPERAGELGEPVVEAEPVVVKPVHVRGPALVALGIDLLLLRRVAERDHPTFASRQLLIRVEAEHGRMAAAPDRTAVGVLRPERLARIFDERNVEPLEARHVGRIAEDVDRENR